MKPSSNYRSFMNNNTGINKQQKNSPNINSLLSKPTPIKKQLPKKCVTTRVQGSTTNNKPRSSIQELKNSNRLNISKAMEKLTTFNENTIHNLEKNLSHHIREQTSSVLSATYRKTPTKYIENPLLSKIVKNNSTKIDLISLNKEKTLETNNVSYTKLAMKKSENILKCDDTRIQEIYKRFGKQTNFSKYKHLIKPKNSSMIIDTNNMFDSETNSVILNTNNSLLFNKNKSDLAEDIRSKQSMLRNIGNPLYKVIEEETYKTKLNGKKVYSERMKGRDSEGLNFSISSSVVNLNKEDEYSVRYTKSRNSESINKLKIVTENKGNRFRDSNSYLEDSINILNKESLKCNTTRAFEINCPLNNINPYDINSTNEFNNYENRQSGSEMYDLNENKKTKVSTKEDTIKSNSNRFEIETIEEQHFMLVRFLHSTKKMLKIQEDNNRLKSIKINLSNNQREVFPVEEIDLE